MKDLGSLNGIMQSIKVKINDGMVMPNFAL